MVPPEELNKVVFGLVLTGVDGGRTPASVMQERPSLRVMEGAAD
jgi:hypothetical protein